MSQFRIVRTVSATVLLAGAVSFSFAGTASAQNQFNCSDFSTQQQAQAQFNKVPGDPSRLDANHNGIACESLPSGATGSNGASGSNGSTGAQAPSGSSGSTGAQAPSGSSGSTGAQAPSGSSGSSGGQNGANQGQVTTVPRGAVNTGDGSTSGSNSMAFILGGLALTVAGGGVVVAARRRASVGA